MIHDAEYFSNVRKMTVNDLWHYQGPIIPWPPSDEDVRWRAWLLNEFIKKKEFRKKQANWSDYRGERLFGEYSFGLRFGLKGNCTAWEKDFRVDYATKIGTIDVKSIVDPSHNLLHPIDEEMCDILVLAMVNLPPSLSTVELLGWCYKDDLKAAPIRRFSQEDPRKVDAHCLFKSKLLPIELLEELLKVVPVEPKVVPTCADCAYGQGYKGPNPKEGFRMCLFHGKGVYGLRKACENIMKMEEMNDSGQIEPDKSREL